jgi:4-amino-4-deoxy-L-arabinose transferase-like glycosyltransferase
VTATRAGSQTAIDVRHGDRRVAPGIFFLVLAVYLLTYSGSFKSNDERALFSGTDSFLKRGEFTTNQIYWDYTQVGVLTTAGDMVPNYEPAQMVLDIPFYLWGRALGAAVQGVLFWGIVISAAAVAVLYLCALELGLNRRSSLLAALVFAFATQAWPYSRTFFREPLTMLAYLVAFYALLRYRPPAPRHWVWPALLGVAVGIAFTTKQISVAILPSVLLLVVVYARQRRQEPARGHLVDLIALLAPLSVILVLGRVYHQVTLGGVELFARDITEYATNPQLSTMEPLRLVRAFLGLTVSPYKGLFWYSPVLLLGLVGFFPFLRRHRWEAMAYALVIGIHWLGYSRYLYWSGGVAWGSRYMLPVIPFLVLLATPVFARLAHDWPALGRANPESPSTRAARLGVAAAWALIVLSAAIQVLGVAIDWRTYEVKWLLDQAKVWGGIGEAIDALYMLPQHSPVLGHLALLLSGTQPLDFAWVQLRAQGTWAVVPAGLVISLVVLGLAVAGFILMWRRPSWAGRVAAALSLILLLAGSLLLRTYRQGDARFDPYQVDRFLQPLMTTIADEAACTDRWPATCRDVLLVPDPVLTDYFLNHLAAPLAWYALDAQPVDTRLLALLTQRYDRIWLARDRNAATDDAEGRRALERYLADAAYKLDEQRVDDWARLLRFATPGTLVESGTPQARLGDLTLERFELRTRGEATGGTLDDGQVEVSAGQDLEIGLHWRAENPPAANYTVFVQLLDRAGQVAAQRDRWPGDGLYPTTSLQAGQIITDNLALPLHVPPGDYRLITGLYQADAPGAPRLTGPGGDFVPLGTVRVK